MAVLSFKVQADYEKVVRLREEIAKLETQLKSFGKNTPLSEIKAVEKRLAAAKTEFNSVATKAAEAGAAMSSFKRVAAGLAGVFTVQKATEFANTIAQVRGEFQKLEIAFETMLQSKEKADALMAQIVDTAAKTPFDLQGVASGAKQLLAYGVASEKVNETLIRLGDIASGLSIPLGDLVYLYGTTMAQGRMYTMDLRQFQGRGIPMAEELAKVMGVAKGQVSELVTAGKIGFKEMEQAIWNMTNAGGKFAGLMEKQSKTITGQISNLGDAVDQMFNEIGRANEGLISGAIGTVSQLVENYEQVGKIIGGLITTYGAYKAAIIALNTYKKVSIALSAAEAVAHRATAIGLKNVTTATVLFTRAQKALNATMLANPYVLAGVAVAGLAAGIYALVTAKTTEEKISERVNKQIEDYKNNLEQQKQKLGELLNKLKDVNSTETERAIAMEQLRDLYPNILKNLSDEELLKLSVADATKMLADEQERLLRANLASQIAEATKGYDEALKTVNQFKSSIGENKNLSAKNADYTQAKADLLKYRVELENLMTQYNKLDETAEKARFLELPADQKIVSLKNSNAELDAEIKELDKMLAELHKKKEENYVDAPAEFGVSYTGGFLYAGKSEEDVLAEIQRLREQKALNEKDIEENQKKLDEQNKALTDKQKKAAYDRQNAEKKAAEELIKLRQDLNDKITQAELDSMDEGYAKTLKQLEVNLKKEKQAIEQQKKSLLKTKHNNELQKWLAEDPEGRKAYDFKYTATLTPEEQQMFAKMGEQAQQKFNEGRADANAKWEKEGEFILRQFAIDNMLDSVDRENAQRELDREKEVHNLEQRRDAYIEAARAAHLFAEEKRMAEDPDYEMEAFDVEAANARFNEIVTAFKLRQNEENLEAEREAWQQYFIEYGTFQQKVLNLTQQYADKIAKAQTDGEKASLMAERDRVLENLKNSMNKAYQNIFKDPTKMSLSSVKDAIKLAREEIKKITDKGVMNEDDINNVKILQEALDKLTDYASSAPFAGFGDGLDGVVSKFNNILAIKKRIEEAEKTGNVKAKVEAEEELEANKELLAKNLAGVGVDAFANGLSTAAEAMRQIADISGDPQLAQTADILNGTANVVTSVTQGAATGGWIGALVGGLTSIMSEVTGAIMDSQVAMAQNKKAIETFEHDMRLWALSIDENVYDTIFGENLWAKITQTRELLKESKHELFDYSSQYRKLTDTEVEYYAKLKEEAIKNDDKDTLDYLNKFLTEYEGRLYAIQGTFAGVGNAIVRRKGYNGETLKEMFAEYGLFDEYGALNVEKLEEAKLALEALQNMELTDSTGRDRLQEAIEYAEKVVEYENTLREAAKDYMGSIGDSLGDAIVNGILRGEDALESFSDVAGGIIEQIAKDFASSWMIDNYLNTFSDQMQDAFLSGDAQDITKIVGDIVAGLPNVLEASEEATRQILDMTKGTDYDLYEKYAKEGAQQEASKKGYQTLSEDTGNELVGRALAQYESNLRMEEAMRMTKESVDIMSANQVQIRDIAAESRALIADSYLELQQIRENTGAIIKPIKNLSEKIDKWDNKIMGL